MLNKKFSLPYKARKTSQGASEFKVSSAKSKKHTPMAYHDGRLNHASGDDQSFTGFVKRKDSVTDYVSERGIQFGNLKGRSKRGSIRIDDDEYTKGHHDSTSTFGGGIHRHHGKSPNDSLDHKMIPAILVDESE